MLAPCALPHLRRRLFHMKRFPNGVDHDFFHQKRVPENHPPYVDEQYVEFPSGHSTVLRRRRQRGGARVGREPRVRRAAHVALARARHRAARLSPDRPRPDVRGQWRHVRKIALVVKEVMDELGLKSFPKTSGSTGLHVLAPIKPELGVPRGAAAGEGDGAGGRAADRRPGGGDDDLEGGRPARRVRRLRPERA